MYLFIDTNQSRFAFFQHGETFDQLQWNTVSQNQSLSREIQAKMTSFKGILVLQGKGAFSQTREGVVFANIYHQVKQVPLLSLSEDELEGKELTMLVEDLENDPKGVLLPHYFAEPNIS